MRLPRPSLFVRTFSVLAGLMLASVLVWMLAYENFEREPRAQQLGGLVTTMINLVRPALVTAQPEARLGLMMEFAQRENIRIYPAYKEDRIAPPEGTKLLQRVFEIVRENTGPSTRFARQVDGVDGFWVSFEIAPADEYWMMIPAERISPDSHRAWLGWGVLWLAFSLLGAWARVEQITRPLSRLALAARAMGRGEVPPRLTESGPPELSAVARAFNQMSADLTHIESDRALSLAGISHDLRTPLTRLRLEIEMANLDPDAHKAMTQDIDDMDAIIDKFLDYARGDGSEPFAPTDLAGLIGTVAETFSRRGRAIEVDTDPKLSVLGQPLSLRRALGNLIQNAFRYAPDDQPITVRTERNGQWIFVDVMDRGPGIAPEDIERVKRAFVRGDNARTGASGSGLGLAIVERIARQHGGRLDLMPRPGGGLIARIALSHTRGA